LTDKDLENSGKFALCSDLADILGAVARHCASFFLGINEDTPALKWVFVNRSPFQNLELWPLREQINEDQGSFLLQDALEHLKFQLSGSFREQLHRNSSKPLRKAEQAEGSESDDAPDLHDRKFLRHGSRPGRDGLPTFRWKYSRPER
jgi:hypothetical protein